MFKKRIFRVLTIVALWILCISNVLYSRDITVGIGQGYEYQTIQAAIDDANNGDIIMVAPEEYYITEPITFRGKAITLISEAGPESTTIHMSDSPGDLDRASVIVFENGETETSVLEGFTISGGTGCLWEYPPNPPNPGGDLYLVGGGIFCINSSPMIKGCIISENHIEPQNPIKDIGGGVGLVNSSAVITRCTISNNSTVYWAGGVYIFNGSPVLTDCTISHNILHHPDGQGGGMITDGSTDSQPLILNCTISENSAPHSAGGVQVNLSSQPTFKGCKISDNTSFGGIGGILCSWWSTTTLENCIIARNSCVRIGGGVGCGHNAEAIVTNCTIIENIAGNHSGGISSYDNSSIIIKNCIIYGNTAPSGPEIGLDYSYYHTPTNMSISYCNVKGGLSAAHIGQGTTLNWEEGNINVDPLFVNPGYWADVNNPNVTVDPNDPNAVWIDGDYHLKSQAGRFDPNSKSWVFDDVTSPCIDVGDPNSPVGDELFPNGGRINMGAYGGTREASMSLETGGLPLPDVAFIYSHKSDEAQSFQSLLDSYGCSTTLVRVADVPTTALDSFNLIILANDTQYETTWDDPNAIIAIEDSGKPIIGLGNGGYDFFGLLGLSIGSPYGGIATFNSITVVDPNYSLFSTPYPIDIPQDGMLELYTTVTRNVSIYLWPDIPETIIAIGQESDSTGYYTLVTEHNRYLLWGFTESPDIMTETGKKLFINTVIWMANEGW